MAVVSKEICIRCIQEAGEDPNNRKDVYHVYKRSFCNMTTYTSVACPSVYVENTDYAKHGDMGVIGKKPPVWCPWKTTH